MMILVFYQGWCRWFEEDMDSEVVLHNGFRDIARGFPHVSDSSQIVPFVRRGMFLVKCTHVDMAAVASTWYCTRPLMFVGLNPSFTPSPLRASYSRGTRRAKRGSVSWGTKSQKHPDGFCTWLVEVGAKTQSPRQPDDQSTRLAKVAASTTGPCTRLAGVGACLTQRVPRGGWHFSWAALSWPRHEWRLACAGDPGGSMPAETPLHEVGSGKRCTGSSKESLSRLAGVTWLVLTGAWALFWVLPCSLKEARNVSAPWWPLHKVGRSRC